MGASASLFTPELALQLSEESLQEYYQYQEGCEAQQLDEEEMFYMCEKKYNSLLEKDKAKMQLKKTMEAEAKAAAEVKAKEEGLVLKMDQDHMNMMKHEHNEEESLTKELQQILSDVHDIDIAEFDQTYTQVLVKKVFDIDKYDRLHKKGLKSHHASGSTSPEEGDPPRHEAFMCHLCSIYFESKTVLDSHIEHSELHRKNEKEREKRVEAAHNEALRLTALAKTVVQAFYMGLQVKEPPVETKKLPAGSYEAIKQEVEQKERHHKEVRERWRHGIDKVLHRRMCEKFTHHLMTRINVPRGVELLYEGSKYFHRTKTTYDLRFLYHPSFDLIEIVPTYVPFNHDTSQLEESPTNVFLAAKRIYLRHSEIVKAFFGYNIVHTELTDDLHVGDAPLMQGTKGSFHRAEIDAMDVFISNRLKIHKSHGPADALFFDLHGIAHDSLVKELPPKFTPVPVEVEVIANIWHAYAGSAETPDLSTHTEGFTSNVGTEKFT